MTSIKHVTETKVEIKLEAGNFLDDKKLEELIKISHRHGADHEYKHSTGILSITSSDAGKMHDIIEEVKEYLFKSQG